MTGMTVDQSIDLARKAVDFDLPGDYHTACITMAAEVLMLRGQRKVLADLLGLSLGVIQTTEGESHEECQQLMELQNQIVAALKGVI